MQVGMSPIDIDKLGTIETAIAEAVDGINRQQQMIADFQEKGYNVTAPLTLLSCLLVNLRKLEDRRREEMRASTVVL
jgi:hypothetical protein